MTKNIVNRIQRREVKKETLSTLRKIEIKDGIVINLKGREIEM